jgi:DNA-directed RNA polymerase specialized sigma24 family protein
MNKKTEIWVSELVEKGLIINQTRQDNISHCIDKVCDVVNNKTLEVLRNCTYSEESFWLITSKKLLTKNDISEYEKRWINIINPDDPSGIEGQFEYHLIMVRNFAPAKMNSYSLAKAIVYVYWIDNEVYIKLFLYKIIHILRKYLKGYKDKDKMIFIKLLYENIYFVLRDIIKKIEKEKFDEEITKYEERNTKKLLFQTAIDNKIWNMVKSDYIESVISDIKLVEQYELWQTSFWEIEKIFKRQLLKFACWKRIKKVEKDDMYQEWLLVLLNVIKAYRWKNYAKIRSLLKKSLQNRYTDLIRYSRRQKRSIDTFSATYSEIEWDSEILRWIENIIVSDWENHNRLEWEVNLGFSDILNKYIAEITTDSKYYYKNSNEFDEIPF